MAQAITTQNQNVQLTKTFIVAFGAVLLAIPIVAVITATVVQAQFASLVSAGPVPAQTNTVSANHCELPADEKQAVLDQAAAAQSNKGGLVSFKWLPWVNQSNSYSESHVTNTTTDNSKVIIKDNGNTDNRWSGNTLINDSFNKKTIIKDNGNTLNLLNNVGNTTTTNNVVVANNGNTVNDNDTVNTNLNSGNTVNDNDNTNINSGNVTSVQDNDGVDIL